jgi:8-oxo-dGTP pyrophosphatase MutT (NUDIX family)
MNTAEQNNWQIIDATTVYNNKWIEVIHHNVINPSGGNGIYGKVHFKNKAIGIVPIDANGYTYLVGQYRFTINQYSWEIPEGGCPLQEDSLQAAQRELLEETGLVAGHWQYVGKAFLSNSVSDELSEIYIATQLTQQQAQPEETEQLQVKKVLLTDAFTMVHNHEITDAVAVIALQQVELQLLKGTLKL